MGFGDGFYKQVPDNIVLDTSSPLFENIVDNNVNLYVSTTGDDTNGDGSESNPYATPQRAVDAIPDNLAAGISVEISCGAGTFEFPDTSNLQPRITVTIVGDTSNPVFSIPVGSVPFNAIAGKYSKRRGNIGAYAESITDESHWMFIDFSVFNLGKVGAVIQGSTSPEIDMIWESSYDPTSFADSAIYAYATTFILSGKSYFCKTVGQNDKQFTPNIKILGIEITATDNNPYLEGFSFHACKFTHSSTFFNPYLTRCYLSSFVGSNMFISLVEEVICEHSHLKGGLQARGSNSEIRRSLTTNSIDVFGGAFFFMSDIDFESSGVCIKGYYGGTAVISNCSVASTRSSFINVIYTNCFFTIAGTIAGSVTGDAIVLRRGSQVTGAETHCNGSLTAGGYEIVLGGDATEAPPTGRTFSSLPATDLTATHPELCRAD